MCKTLTLVFAFFLQNTLLFSQVLPKEGSVLNYILIGFSFPEMKSNSGYKIEIADRFIIHEDSFKKHIIKTSATRDSKIILRVPSFGKSYTWRATSGKVKSKLYHFSTGINANVDKELMRLRVLKTAEQYSDAYVLLDGAQAMYDMQGEPVWFLPLKNELHNLTYETRDLKLSPRGTISFLNDQVFEVDLNGDILWHGPDNGLVSGGPKELYHHQFNVLTNGNYLAMGNEFVGRHSRRPDELPRPQAGNNPPVRRNPIDDSMSRKLRYGTLIEYDKQGNIVWSWKASGYFKNSDISFDFKPVNGRFTHDNAFYFDEKQGFIYISYKTLNRIIKMKYPEGTVLETYGETYKEGASADEKLFCGQHCCILLKNGNMCLFNNNDCNKDSLPGIVILKLPQLPGDTLKKVWEYQCQVEEEDKKNNVKLEFVSGGGVQELPDGSIFANMGTNYSKVLIVDMNKKVLWSAMLEKLNIYDKIWQRPPQYKASMIVDRAALEQLIWSSEMGYHGNTSIKN